MSHILHFQDLPLTFKNFANHAERSIPYRYLQDVPGSGIKQNVSIRDDNV
jgi:hypothetical protein